MSSSPTKSTSVGSSTTNTTQNTSSTPPAYAQPAINANLANIGNVLQTPYSPFPYTYDPTTKNYTNLFTGATQTDQPTPTSNIAPLNTQQNRALGMIEDRATNGSPVMDASTANMTRELSGANADPNNPALQNLFKTGSDALINSYNTATVPQLQSAANRAGAFGGSADQLVQGQGMLQLGQSLGDLSNNIFGTAYQKDLDRQMQANALAPTTASQPYADAAQLMGAGDIQQQFQQGLNNEQQNQWTQALNYPTALSSWASSVLPSMFSGYGDTSSTGTSNTNSTNTATQSGGQSTLGSILGGVGSALGVAGSVLSPATGGLSSLLGMGSLLPTASGGTTSGLGGYSAIQSAMMKNLFGG